MNKKESEALLHSILHDFENPRGGIEERMDLDIRRHRKGWGRFVLADAEGKPVSGAKITLKQKKHAFQFGCNLFKLHDFSEKKQNDLWEKRVKQLFNIATIPFYWDTLEPEQGKPRFAKDSPKISRRPATDDAVDWCLANGIRPKGHWLFCDNFVPGWLPKNGRDMMSLLEKRIAELAERYGRKVTIWDAVNEAFSQPRHFSKTIGWSVTPQNYVADVFRMAAKNFPLTTELIYNDGEYISFGNYHIDNSPMYLLARNLQMQGVRLGGLGFQFHMWGGSAGFEKGGDRHNIFMDPNHLFRVLDQYSLLGIPLHITEITFPCYSDWEQKTAEKLQAKMVESLYKLWFSCENMESIVYWNFADNTAYAAENKLRAGLVDKDMNPKPSFEVLDQLINHEWHTETAVETDACGIADWNGFYGDYEAEIKVGRTKIKQDVLLRKDGENEIRMELK